MFIHYKKTEVIYKALYGKLIPDLIYIILDYGWETDDDYMPHKVITETQEKWVVDYRKVQEVGIFEGDDYYKRANVQVPDMPNIKHIINEAGEFPRVGRDQVQSFYGLLETPDELSKCINLKTLDVIVDYCDDLDFLSGLTDLEYLEFDNRNVHGQLAVTLDLSPLRNCKKLKYLKMDGYNDSSNLTPLVFLPLENIEMDECSVKDLKPLKFIKTLKRLFIRSYYKLDPEPVKHIPDVEIRCHQYLFSRSLIFKQKIV